MVQHTEKTAGNKSFRLWPLLMTRNYMTNMNPMNKGQLVEYYVLITKESDKRQFDYKFPYDCIVLYSLKNADLKPILS